MSKKKGNWLTWSLGTFVGAKGVKYFLNHPNFISDLKHDSKSYFSSFKDFINAAKNFKGNVDQLKAEIPHTQATVQKIQKSVGRFNYKNQPRLTRINELQTHMNQEIESIQKTIATKKRK